MEVVINRKYKKKDYTIGELYINGVFFCNTLEDTDRGLSQHTPLDEIKNKKIYGKTAIPIGTYKMTLDVVSPKYSRQAKYHKIQGKLPRLLEVPGFDGILIHIGNTANDSHGCILVGYNTTKGKVLDSTNTFFKLYDKLKESDNINVIIK
jgi:hypothetical protein